ncbi:MAG: hypothetical protein KDG49_02620 [Geminicoccaceae bacterium]|jgi:hypothetical protein|nr:hypothetical protein [Geminicoccaceae bacterium]
MKTSLLGGDRARRDIEMVGEAIGKVGGEAGREVDRLVAAGARRDQDARRLGVGALDRLPPLFPFPQSIDRNAPPGNRQNVRRAGPPAA